MEPYAAADQVWAGGLIFARVGAMLMTIPGVGEAYVPPRIRLSMALVISIALAPVVVGYLPPLPATMGGVAGWVIREVATGLMIGALLRMMLSALATAGEIVSLQTTLAFAQTANPFQAQPGSDPGRLPDPAGRDPDLRHRHPSPVHRRSGRQL